MMAALGWLLNLDFAASGAVEVVIPIETYQIVEAEAVSREIESRPVTRISEGRTVARFVEGIRG